MPDGVIEQVHMFPLEIPLLHTFATSKATQHTCRSIVVEVCADGLSGFGEVDPRPHITGETIASALAILRDYLIPAVVGKSFYDLAGIHEAMNIVDLNPSAKAAIDIAVHDLLGKATNQRLCDLLGGGKSTPVTLNAWAGIEERPDAVIEIIEDKVRHGFNRAAKFKVGKDYATELELARRLGSSLPGAMDLIVDVNQAWTAIFAKRKLGELASAGVTIVEQPVRSDDLLGMQMLTASAPMSIMADESVWSARDAFNLVKSGAATMLNLKILKCGGLHPAQKFLSVAESAGVSCMVGSTTQTSISAAAQAHLASAARAITLADILVPGEFLVEDVASGFEVHEGKAVLSSKPGLGLEVDRRQIDRFLLR